MSHSLRDLSKPLGTIWLACEPESVVTVGLQRALEEQARVHSGTEAPKELLVMPSCVILWLDGQGDIPEGVRRVQEQYPETPILVFGTCLDLPLAETALRAKARAFIHAEMGAEQVLWAVEVAIKGELVAPRKLLEYLIFNETRGDLDALSARQREILDLVVEGLSNAEIGNRLYLSESTIKQHLRAAYKLLGVKKRTEAAKLFRERT